MTTAIDGAPGLVAGPVDGWGVGVGIAATDGFGVAGFDVVRRRCASARLNKRKTIRIERVILGKFIRASFPE